MKKAVLTIDVEDWFHLDYLDRASCDESKSLLSGLQIFLDILDEYSIKASFFVLGEVAEKNIGMFSQLVKRGHDVGSHGWSHKRPLQMSVKEFRDDLTRSYNVTQEINGNRVFGYRAPCFSLDRERLNVVRESGFAYDASRINFDKHPLYGSIDISDFNLADKDIYVDGDFYEFETSTLSCFGRTVPISGGGYLRIFPWFVMKWLVSKHLKSERIYNIYIHPFELSRLSLPDLPKQTPLITRWRCRYGRSTVETKLRKLILLIKKADYEFTTFSSLRADLSRSART